MILNYREESDSIENSEVELDIDLEDLMLPGEPSPNWKKYFFLSLAIIALLGLAYNLSTKASSKKDFLIEKDGEPALAPWREAKLEKELTEIDEAEQYALVAKVAGDYPYFSCTDGKTMIHLNALEIWRYGVTRKTMKGRYKSGLPDQRLAYTTQFEGTLSECLKEEKRKIYRYPLLPECLARPFKLIRPPGNRNDS